jgi:hypothetical protein
VDGGGKSPCAPWTIPDKAVDELRLVLVTVHHSVVTRSGVARCQRAHRSFGGEDVL